MPVRTQRSNYQPSPLNGRCQTPKWEIMYEDIFMGKDFFLNQSKETHMERAHRKTQNKQQRAFRKLKPQITQIFVIVS